MCVTGNNTTYKKAKYLRYMYIVKFGVITMYLIIPTHLLFQSSLKANPDNIISGKELSLAFAVTLA